MAEKQPIQVMRFVSRGSLLDSVASLEQLKGYGFLEEECIVAPFVPFGGQPILIMLKGAEDKVRIDERSYRQLKHRYSGVLDPEVERLIEDVDGYLKRTQEAIRMVDQNSKKNII